ncbi:MAG: apolipoprotein N-acyltransferase [Gammaproteobacteria bacterium]
MSAASASGAHTARNAVAAALQDGGARLRTGIPGDVLALICGALTVLAFAPFGLYLLASLTLAALFWLLQDISAGRAAWRGFLFGTAEFAWGVHWLYISIHTIGDAPLWLTFLILTALVAVMAVYSALTCGLAVWLAPRAGAVRWLLVLPALWTVFEWLRGWLLTGFPWLSLGYSQIGSALKGYAPLLGVYGVSLAVALSAGLLLSLLTARVRRRMRLVSLALLLAVWLAGGLLANMRWTHPSGQPMQVSLIQGNIPQTIKWDPQAFRPTLALYRRLTDAHWDSRLIIWPESAIPEYADQVQRDYLEPLQRAARAHGTQLLIGVPTENLTTGAAYNSVISLGGHDGVYNKRHLVPLAEYFPLPKWVRRWLESMNLPYSSFTPGAAHQPLLEIAGYPVGVSICYEDAFGSEIMRALPRAAFLVNVSDDGWFGDSIALPQHLEIARMRALEAGRYLLRDTNTGITAVIGPRGRIRESLPADVRGVLTAEFTPYAGSTPYSRLGNPAIVVLASLLLAAGLCMRFLRRR